MTERESLVHETPVTFSEGRGYFVRPSDIPEPYRSRFLADSAGSTTIMVDGEQVHFLHDWFAWLDSQFPALLDQARADDMAAFKFELAMSSLHDLVGLASTDRREDLRSLFWDVREGLRLEHEVKIKLICDEYCPMLKKRVFEDTW